MMEKRREEGKRQLLYNHFDNIGVLSTKTGLLKTLRDYYALNKQAVDANYKV